MVTQAHEEPITRPAAKAVVYGAPVGLDLTEQTSPARLQEWFRHLLKSVSESTSSLSQNIRKISTPDHSEVKKEVDDAFDDDENLFGDSLSRSLRARTIRQPSRSSSEIEPDPQATAHMSTMHPPSYVVKFRSSAKQVIERRVARRIDLMFHCHRACGQKFYTEQAIQEHLNRGQYHEETRWSTGNKERLTKSARFIRS
ncbi:hypothetical protein B0H11DRAFT_1908506 [Mycena galericulata]|nr:hypothetical protein B0H11DRAFT_1908506 [Mycena galericulata]